MKTIWITGGSSGIGLAVAEKFLEENWCVVISSRSVEKINNAVYNLKKNTDNKNIHGITCDVANYNQVRNTVNEINKNISPINIALLNAAAYSPNKTQDFDIKNYELLIEVNLRGTLNCIDVLKDYMKNKNSHIAIVSSPVGFRGMPTAGAYGMTKAAMISMTKTLAHEWGSYNIRVNAIAPGLVDTHFASAIVDNPRLAKGYTQRAALSKIGKPEEIAGIVCYLASSDSAFVTGQCMVVDGGYL